MKKINGTMMQYFEWYMDCHQNLWNQVSEEAKDLAKLGITAIWLPPAYKGAGGGYEVGYGAYDLYDLGEFDQKGTIKTKYGSREEYLNCLKVLKKNKIASYADIVLNHKMGADIMQTIPATKVDYGNHNEQISDQETVKVATKFTFPGRKHKYSDFEWNWTHFTGVDYDENSKQNAIFKFKDKDWSCAVDEEFGNFDYLMGVDLDFKNEEVVKECKNWGKWYLETTNVDGLRLDAVKHIDALFYKDWVRTMRAEANKELYVVGEYWTGDVSKLHRYIAETEGEIALFDAPLHFNFEAASKDDNYDLGNILEHTLVKENPTMAVTFVDNHDTQPDQALQSYVERWFKPAAYSLILLRTDGYPCVFYGDYYGMPYKELEPIEGLKTIIKARKELAYGEQHDYFDHKNYIGWTLGGDNEHLKSGLAVVISNAGDGEKRMYIGTNLSGEKFVDCLNNCEQEVTIDEEGFGTFFVKGRSTSIWVRK